MVVETPDVVALWANLPVVGPAVPSMREVGGVVDEETFTVVDV